MKLTNSYIFIPKTENNNKVNIKDSIPRIFEKFFNIDFNNLLLGEIEENPKKTFNELSNKLNKIIKGNFVYAVDKKNFNIFYQFINANDVCYLDITINDSKKNIIECLECLNNIFLLDENFTKNYITILSYDNVSEYYCNKINPLLNKFERKFRKLLFLIFTSQFKEMYFETTAPKHMIDMTKEKIQNKNKIYRIQNYFYSLDMGTLRSYLFDKTWTPIEEKFKEKVLNKDLCKINPETLKNMIKDIEPKSNWDRFFKNKGFSDDIDKTMKIINDLRNIVAHNKIINKNDYNLLLNLLKKNTIIIDKAINITEEIDFKIINRNKQIEIIENFRNTIMQAFDNFNMSFYPQIYEKIANELKDFASFKDINKL